MSGAAATVGIRSGSEEPPFETLERFGPVEIRRYGDRIAAETRVEGPEAAARYEGFRRLAGYIFGGNGGGASIAMTVPVAQAPKTIAMTTPVAAAPGEDGSTIRFFMPGGYRRVEDLPAPRDERVRLVDVPATTYAVLRFSGALDAAAMQRRRGELLKALAKSRWRVVGAPFDWFYDPPWTLAPLRRNEAVVEVAS